METVQVAFGTANDEIWGSLRRQHPEKKPEKCQSENRGWRKLFKHEIITVYFDSTHGLYR